MAEDVNWIYISLLSIVFFKTINKLVIALLPPPEKLRDQSRKVWIWENLCTSLVHSIVSASLSVYSVYSIPSIFEDMINTRNNLTYYALAISIGYFLYDMLDLAVNDGQRSLCVIIHHVLVISSFLVCVVSNKYIPFAIFALLVEVNSIFLHTRRIMRMCDFDPNGVAFKINKVLLVVTFVIIRLVVLGWVTVCLVLQQHAMSRLAFSIGFGAMCVSILQNLVLLNQVWSSDAKHTKQFSQVRKEKVDAMKDYDENENVRKKNSVGKLKQILELTSACAVE